MSRSDSLEQKREATATLARNLQLKAELLRIGRALNDRGIDFVVLKGVPLAERVYGGISARDHLMQDNDILVRQADLDRAISALKSVGYTLAEHRTSTPRHDIEFEMKLQRTDHGVPLLAELHWHAFPPLLYPVDEDLLWQHTEDFKLSGITFRVFDPALTLVQLASHFVQHLGKATWVLRDFATSYNRWHESLGASELTKLARELGLTHVLAFVFEAANAAGLLEAEPAEVNSHRARLLHAASYASPLSTLLKEDYARLLAFALLAKPRHLPRWLLRQVFPPIEVMALIYRTSVSPALYPRYISRLFRPLARGRSSKVNR